MWCSSVLSLHHMQGKEFLQVFKIYVHGVCKIFPWVFFFGIWKNILVMSMPKEWTCLYVHAVSSLFSFLVSTPSPTASSRVSSGTSAQTNQCSRNQQLATAKDVMLYLGFTGSWQQETTAIASKPVMTTTTQEFLHRQLQSEWAMFKTLQPFRTLSPVIHTSSCQTLSSVKGIPVVSKGTDGCRW